MDNKIDIKRIDYDRNTVIDAAIMRIMKTYKQLKVSILITKVIEIIKIFQANNTVCIYLIQMINKRVGNLVERDYLELDCSKGMVTYI